MSRSTLSRVSSSLLVTAALLTPAGVWAAGARASTAHPPSHAAVTAPAGLGGVWIRLVHLLAPEGCMIDPHGCAANPHAAAPIAGLKAMLDEGCGLDPHGACSPVH